MDRTVAVVLDMYYGTREEWFDNDLPFEMNVRLADPAYIDFQCREDPYYDYSVGVNKLNK